VHVGRCVLYVEKGRVEWAEAVGGHAQGLPGHRRLLSDLTRRGLLARAAGAAAALSLVDLASARAQAPGDPDGTMQAFSDTMVPGRRVAVTASGAPIHPQAIAGVDSEAGAVEADALALYHHPKIGFDALEPVFLAELSARSLPQGGEFLSLPWDARVTVCIGGLAYDNPTRTLWEAAAAVPFTAFCAAALEPQSADKAPGYRVMGLPGAAPHGYRTGYSYRRALSRERTRTGSLP
jgi:hypothetical protein